MSEEEKTLDSALPERILLTQENVEDKTKISLGDGILFKASESSEASKTV